MRILLALVISFVLFSEHKKSMPKKTPETLFTALLVFIFGIPQISAPKELF